MLFFVTQLGAVLTVRASDSAPAAAAAPAAATTADAAAADSGPSKTGDTLQEVVVSGIRANLEKALDELTGGHGGSAEPPADAPKADAPRSTAARRRETELPDVIEAQLQSFWRIDVTPLSLTDLRTNGRRWVLRSMGPMVAGEETDV